MKNKSTSDSAVLDAGQKIWLKNEDLQCSVCGNQFVSNLAELVAVLNGRKDDNEIFIKLQCPEWQKGVFPVHVGELPMSGVVYLQPRTKTFQVEGADPVPRRKRYFSV